MVSRNFEPLRITAELMTGVVSDEYLPLDGILLYQATRRACGVQLTTRPGGENVKPKYNVTTPLLNINKGRPDWYFACSWAYPRPWWAAEGKDHWNKRFDSGLSDMVDFAGRRGNVIIGSGKYKAYHMPIFYRAAQRVTWYCVGDAEKIAELLSVATHIGKKSAQGWGRVARWDIDPIDNDYSVWKNGELMRGVPAKDVEGRGAFNLARYGVRPSYYRQKNQMLLAMPS